MVQIALSIVKEDRVVVAPGQNLQFTAARDALGVALGMAHVDQVVTGCVQDENRSRKGREFCRVVEAFGESPGQGLRRHPELLRPHSQTDSLEHIEDSRLQNQPGNLGKAMGGLDGVDRTDRAAEDKEPLRPTGGLDQGGNIIEHRGQLWHAGGGGVAPVLGEKTVELHLVHERGPLREIVGDDLAIAVEVQKSARVTTLGGGTGQSGSIDLYPGRVFESCRSRKEVTLGDERMVGRVHRAKIGHCLGWHNSVVYDARMSVKKIRTELRALADPVIAEHSARFFKTGPGEYGEGDRFLGIRVPVTRKVARKHRGTPLRTMLSLLKSRYHEERLLAVLMMVDAFQRRDEATRKTIYEAYLDHATYVNNWDIVDSSAHKIVGAWLWDQSKAARKILHELANSEVLWERRIAVIATFYFIDKGDFKDSLRLARNLLKDQHDLIHKAVGWMLREIGNRDREAETAFLDKHYKRMPRTMLRYAIEKYPEKRRRAYLEGRV